MRLITGGSGFLGVALAKRLRELNYEVVVYDLSKSENLPEDVEFIKGDIRDIKEVKSATKEAEVIYHLAALLPQRRRSEKEMYQVNVGGTKNILNCALKNNVKRVVYISSVQVYGPFEGIIKEDAPKNPIGIYAQNKLASEKLCFEYFKKYNLGVSILRPPTIIGKEIDDKYILNMLSIIKNNGILPVIGNGKQKYNAIHIADCVEAVIKMSEDKNAIGEVFNIGTEDVLEYVELISELKKHFRSKVKIIKLNKFITLNLLRMLDFLRLSPVERVYIELSVYSNLMDISKIKEKLKFIPKIKYKDAWCEMYEWFCSGR